MKRVSTTYLITCAVLGVAGGILLIPANWLSTALFLTVPVVSMAVAGLWILPAVIALRLLQRPGAGLLVGLISGLVTAVFSGYGLMSVVTNVFWAFFAEVGFLLVLYRFWSRWLHYLGALILAVAYPLLSAVSFNLWALTVDAQILFFVLDFASVFAATFLGILIADGLARAGVARAARRRSRRPTHPGP